MIRCALRSCALPTVLVVPALILTLALLRPPSAAADGKFVWRGADADIGEPEQKAILVHESGTEELVLSVRYEGAPESFGWIIPFPSTPDIERAHAGLFDRLSILTQTRQAGRSGLGRAMEPRYNSASASAVTVIDEMTVGIFDAVILRATDGTALEDWLSAAGFVAPDDPHGVLDRYARGDWVWVALRITASETNRTETARALASGTTEPLAFQFACEEPIFPLEISSLSGAPSEVLLYTLTETCVEPQTSSGSWEVSVYSAPEHLRPMLPTTFYLDEPARSAEHRGTWGRWLSERRGRLVLGKHRRLFEAIEMKDVTFGPYDWRARLADPDSTVRRETITYLGHQTPSGAEALLLDLVRDAPTRGERLTAIWALGRLPAPSAAANTTLDVLLDVPDESVRLEAIQAIGRLRGPRAEVPLIVDALVSRERRAPPATIVPIPGNRLPGDIHVDREARAARRLYYRRLLAIADGQDIPELLELSRHDESEAAWLDLASCDALAPPTVRCLLGIDSEPLEATVILARAGDISAQDLLVDALIRSGRKTTIDAMEERALTGGYLNSFPSGYWTALASLQGILLRWGTAHELIQLSRVSGPSAWHLPFVDDLLRRAAASPRMPDAGTVVLLANVDSLTTADAAALLDVWRRVAHDPGHHLAIPDSRVERWRRQRSDTRPTITVNVTAACVAYALARHRAVDALEETVATLPGGADELTGEVLAAAAHCEDDRFDPAILDYALETWKYPLGHPMHPTRA